MRDFTQRHVTRTISRNLATGGYKFAGKFLEIEQKYLEIISFFLPAGSPGAHSPQASPAEGLVQ
jgi:hypothetical protein